MRGADVAALHSALRREGFAIPLAELGAKEFGAGTFSAVARFQEKYRADVLSPAGLSTGTGFVGRGTRAKLNALFGCRLTPAAASSGELKWYRDSRFGFSIAYPKELVLSEGARPWGAWYIEFSDPRYAGGSSGAGPRYPSGSSNAPVVNAIEIETNSPTDYAGGQTVRIGDRVAKKFIGEGGNPWYFIKGRHLSFRIFFYTPPSVSGYRDHIRIDRFTFDVPESGDIASWKSYTSGPFEYAAKHPLSWSASERQLGSATILGETVFGPSQGETVLRYASVSVYSLPLDQVKRLLAQTFAGASEAAITVGGQNGFEYMSETSVIRRILVARSNRTYLITLDDSVEEAVFFLEQFKFGSASSLSTASSSAPGQSAGRRTWNAMTFQYPASWTVEEEYSRTLSQEAAGEPLAVSGMKLFPPGTSRTSYIGVGGRDEFCGAAHHARCTNILATPFYMVGNDPAVARAYSNLLISVTHDDPGEAFRVLAPSHLEKVRPGAAYQIRWQTREDISVSKVNIVVQPATFRGNTRPLLSTGDIANTGAYLWNVPANASTADFYAVSVSRCEPAAAAQGALGSCRLYQGWSDLFWIAP
jgi:hypothetical protein